MRIEPSFQPQPARLKQCNFLELMQIKKAKKTCAKSFKAKCSCDCVYRIVPVRLAEPVTGKGFSLKGFRTAVSTRDNQGEVFRLELVIQVGLTFEWPDQLQHLCVVAVQVWLVAVKHRPRHWRAVDPTLGGTKKEKRSAKTKTRGTDVLGV